MNFTITNEILDAARKREVARKAFNEAHEAFEKAVAKQLKDTTYTERNALDDVFNLLSSGELIDIADRHMSLIYPEDDT